MSAIKRGNKWWIDFRFNRLRYRKPSPENSRAGARAYEIHLRHKLSRGEPFNAEENKITYRKFAADWLQTYVKNNNKYSEVISKEQILRVHLIPHFGDRKLDAINSLDIEKYKAKKIEAKLSPKTINNHLTVFRKSLQCAFEWGIIEKMPVIKNLKTLPQKYDYLTIKECKQLIEKADGVWLEMIHVVIETGLRFGELIALAWDDIDFKKRELTVKQAFAKGVLGSPKSNQIRYIPMSKSVYEVLHRMEKGEDYIFSDANGKPLKQIACIKKLHRICNRAGIRKIGWHCLRHTFASHLAQAGANIVSIQSLLGHSDIRTTMRYAHINGTALREAINILNRNNEAGESKNYGHNMDTVSAFAVTMSDISKPKTTMFPPNKSEKRAEALFSIN